jgi:hypothetical protein
MPPKIAIVGVYSLPVDDAMITAQARELYGDTPSSAHRERVQKQLESLVLVEVTVADPDAKFNVGDFTQENPELPRDSWQAPWAEAFLTPDGQSLLVERWSSPPKDQKRFRVAFYIHYWQPGQALLSSYGPLKTPAAGIMPDRLKTLVPFVIVD